MFKNKSRYFAIYCHSTSKIQKKKVNRLPEIKQTKKKFSLLSQCSDVQRLSDGELCDRRERKRAED